MILINFKLYQETWGDEGIKLAKYAVSFSKKNDIRVVVAAPALEAVKIQKETGAEVWLQHVDAVYDGKHTGMISMKEAMELGIKGSLVNHSEYRLAKGEIIKIIKMKPEGFEIAVCAHTLGQIDWMVKTYPDWILYEPPELIASKDKSVATEKPEAIRNAVEKCKGVNLMVGAGIKDRNDVCVSIKLGAKGIGLASAYVLGKNQEQLLEELGKGYKDV